jgi:hypothetical protein
MFCEFVHLSRFTSFSFTSICDQSLNKASPMRTQLFSRSLLSRYFSELLSQRDGFACTHSINLSVSNILNSNACGTNGQCDSSHSTECIFPLLRRALRLHYRSTIRSGCVGRNATGQCVSLQFDSMHFVPMRLKVRNEGPSKADSVTPALHQRRIIR